MGHRNTCYCTNVSGHFYLQGQFLAIMALLSKFAKISTC